MYLVYISCFDLMGLIVLGSPLNVIVWNNVCQCSDPPVFKPLLLTVGKLFALKKNQLYKIIDSVSVFGLDFKTCPNLYDLESNVLYGARLQIDDRHFDDDFWKTVIRKLFSSFYHVNSQSLGSVFFAFSHTQNLQRRT